MNETENEVRLRRAKEAVATLKDAEDQARKNLLAAVEATKRARDRFHELFTQNEQEEYKRRKATA